MSDPVSVTLPESATVTSERNPLRWAVFAVVIAGGVFGIVSLLSTNRGSEGNGPAPIASVVTLATAVEAMK